MSQASPGQSESQTDPLLVAVNSARICVERFRVRPQSTHLLSTALQELDDAMDLLAARHDGRPLTLMDAGVTTAPKVQADVRIAGRRQDFGLPVWKDNSGDVRIGLPKVAPQHSGDMDQIVFDAGDLLAAIAEAMKRAV